MTEPANVRLTVRPLDKTVFAETGRTLLHALREAGIEIAAPCNGRGQCGKCRVHVSGCTAPVNQAQDHLNPEEIASGIRLACQVAAGDGMVVTLRKTMPWIRASWKANESTAARWRRPPGWR